MTDPDAIRLDCLRLAHRHDLAPAEVIARAAEYAAYVTTDAPAQPERGKQ